MIYVDTITELDIRQASPSIWYDMGVISKETYEHLISLDRHPRQVQTGLMRKADKSLTDKLYEGYDIYIGKLMKANNITDADIFERNNDAIFVFNIVPEITTFGKVQFMAKNTYELCYTYNKGQFFLIKDTFKLKTRNIRNDFNTKNNKLLKLVENVLKNYVNGLKDKNYSLLHKARVNLEKDPNFYGESLTQNLDYNYKLIKNMIKKLL